MTFYIYIIGGVAGVVLQLSLLGSHRIIALLRIGRQQYPVGSLGIVVQRILLTGCVSQFHDGTAVGHTRGNAHQHGQTLFLTIFKSCSHHIVRLLLVRGFEGGYHGKLTIEPGVLLVL